MNVNGTTVVHIVYSKDRTVRVFHVTESNAQGTEQLAEAGSGQQYTAATPFWSIFWSGQSQTAAPAQSTVIADTRARMITDLITNSTAAYTASFVDAETLDGAAVFHIHLTAQDAANHPLTDLFIDEQTSLVRRALATFRDSSVTDVIGAVTLNFGSIDNYWLATSGEVDATVHAFLTQVSGSATFAASHVVVAAP